MHQITKDPSLHNYIEEFYRFSTREKNRRNNAFGFNFETREGRRFVDEMKKFRLIEESMWSCSKNLREAEAVPDRKNLEQESAWKFVPLERPVHFLSELNREQIITYLWMKQEFQRGNVDRIEEIPYLALYLLELANDLEKKTPEGALREIFAGYDLGREYLESERLKKGNEEKRRECRKNGMEDPVEALHSWDAYLLRLCQSFLVAHSHTAPLMKELLIGRDLSWKMDLLGEILEGRFAHADEFMRIYALQKEAGQKKNKVANNSKGKMPKKTNPIDQAYEEVSLEVMPYVFTSLADTFSSSNLFSECLIPTKEKAWEIDLLPVTKTTMGQKRKIPYSETCYLTEKATYISQQSGKWFLVEGDLTEGSRDFLALILRYSESFLREIFGGSAKKRTAAAFLKKKYARSGDNPRAIRRMKAFLQDPNWEKAIAAGVQAALADKPVIQETMQAAIWKAKQAKTRKLTTKDREKARLDAMDHEQYGSGDDSLLDMTIDPEKLFHAKKDADQVLSWLHEGEIPY